MKLTKRLVGLIVALVMVVSSFASVASAIDFDVVIMSDARKLDQLYSAWDEIEAYEATVETRSNDDKAILEEMYDFISELDEVIEIEWGSDEYFSFRFSSGLWSEYHRFEAKDAGQAAAEMQAIADAFAALDTKDITPVDSINIGVYSPYYGNDSNFTQNYLQAANAMKEVLGDGCTVESWYGYGYDWSTGSGNVVNFQNWDRYGVIIVDSHGSASGGKSWIWCPVPGTYDQQDVADGHLLYSGGEIAVSGTYIEKYCDLPNSFVYMGICEGMKQLGTAEALLRAGAGFVCGYTESVTFYYDGLMMATICAALVTESDVEPGRTMTAEEACLHAQGVHGDIDPYGEAVLIWRGNSDLVVQENPVPVTGVNIVESSVDLYLNNEYTFEFVTTPEDANGYTVEWSSSNTNVATVDSATGLITVTGTGEAEITLTVTDTHEPNGASYSDTATVNVLGSMPLDGFEITPTEIELYPGAESVQIECIFTPENASNKEVIWESADENIATVVDGLVTAGVQAGTTTITATTVEGGYTATATVSVVTLNEALNVPGGTLIFETSSNYPWELANSSDRTFAVSGNRGVNNSTSTLTTTVELEADDVITFDYSVSSESNYDKLVFKVNGSQIFQKSGSVAWTTYTYVADTAGEYTFEWSYSKDSSVNSGDDRACVDNVYAGEPTDDPNPPSDGLIYGTSFELQSEVNEWTRLDEDGDGYNWIWSGDEQSLYTAYEGEHVMSSASYVNDGWGGGAPVNPDNWLVSPVVDIPANATDAYVSFWYVGQDESWAEETFGVYVSTDGGDTWSNELGYYVSSAEYQNAVIDLTAYAGESVNIAIRHYDITDMFMLNIDLFEVYATTDGDVMLGDADEDGEVDSLDALLILRYSIDIIGADELNLENADVNQDGVVNGMDALLVLRMALNIG